MRISRRLAVAATGICLAAGASVPAIASTHHPLTKTHVFPSTLSPNTGVKNGTVMTMKGHNAKKNTTYVCVFGVQKGAKYWVHFDLKTVTSNSKGKVKCVRTFQAYTATQAQGGPSGSHKCPLTKHDRRHGYSCSMSIATTDQTSAANELFKAKH